jgi:hypothetical protein
LVVPHNERAEGAAVLGAHVLRSQLNGLLDEIEVVGVLVGLHILNEKAGFTKLR